MPIDFAAVAAQFSAVATLQLQLAVVAMRGIGAPLARRAAAGRSVELATRAFPIVRFYDGAVTVRLPADQQSVLTLEAPSSFGGQLAAGGLGFVDGLSKAFGPFRSDSEGSAIPRFLTAADRAVAAVEQSVERFRTPNPAMFDPAARQASDLFGLAGLAFTALAEASRQGGAISALTGQLQATLTTAGITGPTRQAATVPDVPSVPLIDTLDTIAFELLGGSLILAVLPQLVETLFDGFRISAYQLVLTELGEIERIVLDARRNGLELVFVGLTGVADRSRNLLLATDEVIGGNVEYQLRFWRTFGVEFAAAVSSFAIGVGDFLGDVVRLLRVIPDMLTALTRFDLTGLLGGYGSAIPSFELNDLLDPTGTRVNLALRAKLLVAIDAAESALRSLIRKVPPLALSAKVRRALRSFDPARRVVGALFSSGGSGSALPVLLEGSALRFHSDFPDLSDTLFGAGRSGQIVAVVDRIERAARTGVDGALSRTRRGFDAISTEFGTAATNAAVVNPADRLRAIGEQSDRLADVVFGPEVLEQSRPADGTFGPLANAFESWLVLGGFETISAVVDGYVAELGATWRARIATGTELTAPITPTSPHLLRKHAVLGRVLVPRMTLRANGYRDLDENLADEVAREFAAAVRRAYRSGQHRLRELAALAPAEGG